MAENDQNMPEPALKYMRTPEESRDVLLSWLREDMVLFAAGACHILAHMFLLHNPNEDFDLIYTKSVNKQSGNHMYVSGGTWAFDFNRWSLEKDLLKINETFAKDRYPNWNYERIVIEKVCRSIWRILIICERQNISQSFHGNDHMIIFISFPRLHQN